MAWHGMACEAVFDENVIAHIQKGFYLRYYGTP
jgi:hypothetical protein